MLNESILHNVKRENQSKLSFRENKRISTTNAIAKNTTLKNFLENFDISSTSFLVCIFGLYVNTVNLYKLDI